MFESERVFAFLDIQPLSRGHAVCSRKGGAIGASFVFVFLSGLLGCFFALKIKSEFGFGDGIWPFFLGAVFYISWEAESGRERKKFVTRFKHCPCFSPSFTYPFRFHLVSL